MGWVLSEVDNLSLHAKVGGFCCLCCYSHVYHICLLHPSVTSVCLHSSAVSFCCIRLLRPSAESGCLIRPLNSGLYCVRLLNFHFFTSTHSLLSKLGYFTTELVIH